MPLKDDVPEKIAVVRMLPGLGDFLVIIPALRAIRSALPNTSITLISVEPAGDLCRRFSYYFNDFENSPRFPGIPESEGETDDVPGFFQNMQAKRFDLAIQMHGDGTVSNIFTALLRSRATAGYYREGNYCPDPAYFLAYQDRESEIIRYLRLVQRLGFVPQGEGLEFPLTKRDRDGLLGIEGFSSLMPQGYICIHPGASSEAKRWPYQNFAKVAEELSRQGWPIVLTGTRAEMDLCHRVENAMKRSVLNVAGRTTLGGMAMLLSDAALVICNDTGVSHLASALNVASVVIFTASDPVRWAPLDAGLHRRVVRMDIESRPELKQGGYDRSGSKQMPTVKMVLDETEALLRPKRRSFA